MNLKQKIVACLGVVFLFLAMLYPVWEFGKHFESSINNGEGYYGTKQYSSESRYEIRFLFNDNTYDFHTKYVEHVDLGILIIELCVIVISCYGLVLVLADRKPQ